MKPHLSFRAYRACLPVGRESQPEISRSLDFARDDNQKDTSEEEKQKKKEEVAEEPIDDESLKEAFDLLKSTLTRSS